MIRNNIKLRNKMYKKLYFLVFFSVFLKALNLEDYSDMITKREKFFTEAFVQSYDAAKIKIDSKSGLESIDFCEFPPDRSLVFGALQNGRFHGEKINDLPFTCNNSSGAKKFFLKNANITQGYHIIRANFPQFLLNENMPKTTSSETFKSDKINTFYYIFESIEPKSQNYTIANIADDRLWIIYSGGVSRYTLIFTKKGSGVEIIMQYLNMPLFIPKHL